MGHRHRLWINHLGYVDTGGLNYGPYNALTMLWQGENLAVVHCKGHTQYWGRNRHYIPASVMVFQKLRADENGVWYVEKIDEVETGRASRRVQADMIEWAKEHDDDG